MTAYPTRYTSSTNRIEKARKIEAVLCDFLSVKTLEKRKILDYGCGSGHISAYFSGRNEVTAADIEDQREALQREEMRFVSVEPGRLPFENASFDIVLLNHVIAYVTDPEELMLEIHRVLRHGGACYFASPNRNFPLEAHSRIPFIHYLPSPVFSILFRRIMRSNQPITLWSYRGMVRLIRRTGFEAREYTVDVLRNPEKFFGPSLPLHHYFPDFLGRVSPTNIFILAKR